MKKEKIVFKSELILEQRKKEEALVSDSH